MVNKIKMKKTINSKIGLTEQYPYIIKTNEVYSYTLLGYGKWDRSPLYEKIKAFKTESDAKLFIKYKKLKSVFIVKVL